MKLVFAAYLFKLFCRTVKSKHNLFQDGFDFAKQQLDGYHQLQILAELGLLVEESREFGNYNEFDKGVEEYLRVFKYERNLK